MVSSPLSVKRVTSLGTLSFEHGRPSRKLSLSDPQRSLFLQTYNGTTKKELGGKRVKILNLEVVKIFPEKNLILVKGAVPGHKGAFVILEK